MQAAGVATFDHREFPLDLLLECKGAERVSVCIPARDEAATIGPIVAAIRTVLVDRVPLVDELVVVDDGSKDATASIAAAAGAAVVQSAVVQSAVVQSAVVQATAEPAAAVQAICGPGSPRAHGKGQAMAAGLSFTTGSIVVFLDGDVENFAEHFVVGLVGPLLVDARLMLVKGCYERPVGGMPSGGGRVTELVARPLIRRLFPALVGVSQPLAGETAIRRGAIEGIALAGGYGVEIGLLIDVVERYGGAAIAQVDLGSRIHRNRPLEELAPQADEVLGVMLDRAGVSRSVLGPAAL